MDKLLSFLNSLTPLQRESFAARCFTTVGYLRNACSTKKKMGEALCLRIAIESGWALKPADIRPDVDWDYMRHALGSTQDNPLQPPPTPLNLTHSDQERRDDLDRRDDDRRSLQQRAMEERRTVLDQPTAHGV